MDTSKGLTCITCSVAFETAELQREHYKCEWHRYNLKRLAVELPPISSETFNEKASSFSTEPSAKATGEFYCKCCKKQLKSQNAMNDHLASRKHQDIEKDAVSGKTKGPKQPKKKTPSIAAEAPNESEEMDDDNSSDWETDDGEEDDPDYDESRALPATSCLFCHQTKSTLAEIKQHMNFHHGFQVPDQQYLVDELGLFKYLGLKVGTGRCCIYCPEVRARFANVESCQRHMRDKEHCKLRRDPDSMIELIDFYDYSPMYEKDDETPNSVLTCDGWSLTLPSGMKVGHRTLLRYYNQYMKPDGAKQTPTTNAIDKARGLFPALAYTGTTGVIAKQAARDLKFIARYRRRFDLRVGVKSNKLFKSEGRYGDN